MTKPDAATATVRRLQALADHSSTIMSVRFAKQGTILVTAAMDKTVIVHTCTVRKR